MKRIVLLSSIFFYCIKISHAQSGELDPSFGTKGIVKTDFGFIYDYNYSTSGRQVLLQPDGSMYILIEAGFSSNRQSYIAKRFSNGSPDISYGNNGFSSPVHIVEASTAQQADNKIVVAGVHSGIYTIARYNTDGNLDNSFDGDGMQVVEFAPVAVAIQSDGKIILAGSVTDGDNDFALARYNTDGSLDNTFDGDGKQTTDFGGNDYAISIAIQNDTKIVIAGQTFQTSTDFVVARYNNDGSLDNTFSGDGKQTTDINSSEDIAKSVAIQNDGKIIVAGYTWNGSTNQFALVRYNIDGTPDNTFSGDGKQITNFSSECITTSLTIQSDGKILLAGYAFTGGSSDFALVRFNIDGSLDNSFGEAGKQTSDFTGEDHAYSIASKSDGKILVIGEDDDGSNFAVARYTALGVLDNTFDGDGKLTDRLHLNQGSTYYTSTKIQSDGKILAAGYTWNGSNYDFALARYNMNGSLDNSFSGDGRQTTDFNAGDDYAYSLAIQNDGKIVLAGVADSNFAVARYNTDGSPDNSFSGGKVTTDFGFDDNAQSVAIQSDGKIVVAGWSVNGIDDFTDQPLSDFALARYNANGSPDNSFSGDGKLTTDFGYDDLAKSVTLQSDGKILVAGTRQVYNQGDNTSQFALARYNTNGSSDNSFSGDGKQLTTINNNAYANSIAIQSDGKIVVGGNTGFESASSSDFALTRYNTSGIIDNTFGEGGIGIQTTYFGSVYKFSNPLAIQSDGKIILAGGANGNFTLARYDNDGTPDNKFSEDGIQITEVSAADDRIEGMAIDDDKLYVAGYGQYPGNLGTVARYLLVAEGPVPVRLVDFTAVLKNNTVLLQWNTASEQNLSGFIIERSADANSFSSIGTVQATGNSVTFKDYSIIDHYPLQRINYYRIKIIDTDGKFMYSKIVAVKLERNNIALQVFPNPARDILFVQAIGGNENAIIQIIDIGGRKLKEIKVGLNGNTSLSVDISNLPTGIYNLVLNKQEKTWTRQFIKE
ncbi:MAG: T9SS type A sorting domain-containing protein [Ginsengibacter sp.]